MLQWAILLAALFVLILIQRDVEGMRKDIKLQQLQLQDTREMFLRGGCGGETKR